MKQTKLREPILYTALWVVSVVIAVILFSGFIHETGIILLDIILGCILVIDFDYSILGWLVAIDKRTDRQETRDMKKYILGKIKDIDDKIEGLKEEKKELLLSIKD